ncbi:MAG: metallopeptidase [Rhodococcus sp.]|nr:metallopeptidase [Rhodococcus sp. (in: high G+C Gram-positive bacteria)]
MARRWWAASCAGIATAVALTVAGCASEISGTATSIYDDPFRVAGLPATSGPSGIRPGVPDAVREVKGGDGGPIDTAAVNAINDIEKYWHQWYPELFDEKFEPVTALLSWDPFEEDGVEFCGVSSEKLVNAGYCLDDHSIGWDRAVLMPQVSETFGIVAMVFVLAHEYGHAIQTTSRTAGVRDHFVREQQADCYAGAFMRHIAEGNAAHFQLNTSEGLHKVLASAVAIGDTDPNNPDNVHGSAFERVTATQIGFTEGPATCVRIDAEEIASRRADLPHRFDDPDDDGELPITEQSIRAFVASIEQVLGLENPPTLVLDGADLGCSDARATDPVSYCPSTNTIGVNVPELARRGTPEEPTRRELFAANVTGDYNGYVLLVSRYTLALQQQRGDDLHSPQTAMRAACLSGVVTRALSPEHPERLPAGSVWLSPGDLDEAVSGLLSDGLAASDVNGKTVPSGFSRVDAFRTGVLSGDDVCETRYR